MSRSEYQKEYYRKNSEKVKARTNSYYHRNKDKARASRKAHYELNKDRILAKNAEWRKANKERIAAVGRAYHLSRKYGISQSQYDSILEMQGGRCFICRKAEDEVVGKFHIDHSHTASEYIPANRIRGILCMMCNQSIIGDRTDPDIYMRASDYLRRDTGIDMPIKEENE